MGVGWGFSAAGFLRVFCTVVSILIHHKSANCSHFEGSDLSLPSTLKAERDQALARQAELEAENEGLRAEVAKAEKQSETYLSLLQEKAERRHHHHK